jgi:hypothetical protein
MSQPCPERVWWSGVLVGGPLMFIGFSLVLTLIGAPLGLPSGPQAWGSC